MGDVKVAPEECWCSVYEEDEDGDPFGSVFPHPIADDVACGGKTVRYVRGDVSDEWKRRAEAAEKAVNYRRPATGDGAALKPGDIVWYALEAVRVVSESVDNETFLGGSVTVCEDKDGERGEYATVSLSRECPMPPGAGIAHAVKRDVAEALRSAVAPDQEHTEWAKALRAAAERLGE